jgi:hypothetical protein
MCVRAQLFGHTSSSPRTSTVDDPDVIVNTTPADFKDKQLLAHLSKL